MSPEELRIRRLQLGLSVSDVAERLNISPKDISAWELGDAPLDAGVADALLNAPSAIRRLLLDEPHGSE